MRIGTNLLILGIVMAAVVWLQIFLSKRESRWLGLILPLVGFAYSLLMVSFIALYEGMTDWEIFSFIASTFLLANIPTLILVAVYMGCRESIRRQKALEKMNIQDLE